MPCCRSCRQQGPGGVARSLGGTEQGSWLPHSPSSPRPPSRPSLPLGWGHLEQGWMEAARPPPPPALGLETHSSLQVRVWRLPAWPGSALGARAVAGPRGRPGGGAVPPYCRRHPAERGGQGRQEQDATKQQPLTGRATATAPPGQPRLAALSVCLQFR